MKDENTLPQAGEPVLTNTPDPEVMGKTTQPWYEQPGPSPLETSLPASESAMKGYERFGGGGF